VSPVDIFISYARADREPAASLAALLELYGYEVWWDRDLVSGSDFEQEISCRLAAARAVVVIWSDVSVKSGWVRDEAADAARREVLVPVTLGDHVVVPFGFRSLHAIPLDTGDPSELLKAIMRRVNAPTKVPPPPAKRPFPWLEAGLALTVVAAVAILLGRIFHSG
jgi:adenylate cyclase